MPPFKKKCWICKYWNKGNCELREECKPEESLYLKFEKR
jgi:hypothetical protein